MFQVSRASTLTTPLTVAETSVLDSGAERVAISDYDDPAAPGDDPDVTAGGLFTA